MVRQSDVVLGQPNLLPAQAMPLGNGSLGVGLWSANGLTAQLNRADTLPDRLSPGQITVPGLSALAGAPDYHATLDLYDGTFTESGGGMTARAYVPAGQDELVVDVTGANPNVAQTAQLALWQPRTPTAVATGPIGSLAQTWVDNTQPGASGQTFGAMAAITAAARDATATVVSSTSVQVQFHPNSDGAFRILVDSPQWTGGNAVRTAQSNFARGAIAGGPRSLVAQLLEPSRRHQHVLIGRYRPIPGQRPHGIPSTRRSRTRHGPPWLAGRRGGPVRQLAGHPQLGPCIVLGLEPADDGHREHRRGRVRQQQRVLRHVPPTISRQSRPGPQASSPA